MNAPTLPRLISTLDATWSPLAVQTIGPFKLRNGAGGGKRVSAATLEEPDATDTEITQAIEGMRAFGQTPLFMLRPGQEAFDARLAAQGFEVIDPSVVLSAPAQKLADSMPEGLKCIPCETPLAAQREIWASDGIGPARIDVMGRSVSPKTYLLGRHADRMAATGFVSADEDVAMLHALVVPAHLRRLGIGRIMTCGAAKWAAHHGATTFTLITTQANDAARALYGSLGMKEVSSYHYRILPGSAE